jgi:hypothetical protein
MPETIIDAQPVYMDPDRKFRVKRASFFDAEQDSYTTPPAQNPDYFERLWNVLPPSVQGNLQRRWGYQLWSSDATVVRKMYEFQQQNGVLRRIVGTAADGTGTPSATDKVIAYNEDGSVYLSPIFTPSAGATSPRMVDSRDFAYFADGVQADLLKWNGATSGGVSKWGIVAPLGTPSVFATNATTGTWSPLTIVSTMGMLVDSNGNIQQLISVNAKGTNTNTFVGTSGVGQPAWDNVGGHTTTDTPVTWTNRGPIGLWAATTFYSEGHFGFGTLTNPAILYDPTTNALFFNNQGGGGTSGSNKPVFNATVGAITIDGTVRWEFLASANPLTPVTGSTAPISGWQPSTFYTAWGGTNNFTKSAITQPSTVTAAYSTATNTFVQTIYLMSSNTGATTPASETNPPWAIVAGQYTDDGDLRWVCLGVAVKTWPFAATAWASGSTTFSALKDTHNNLQVAIVTGTTGGSSPVFPASYTQTNYGQQTPDGGTVIWAAVGPTVAWAATTKWFLPASGFVAPASSSQYGGVSVAGTDTNNLIESVVITGKTGAAEPAWGALGTYTPDSGATWFAVAPIGSSSGNISLSGGRRYFLIYINSLTGGMSDVSPVSVGTGTVSNGQVFLNNLQVSSDPQVDQKVIVATADGGNVNTLYFVAQIPNSQTSYTDNTSEITLLAGNVYAFVDVSGNQFGVFNNEVPGNGQFPTKHRGRIYMLVGQNLIFSKSLAEVTSPTGLIGGRYEEAFPPANIFDVSTGAEVGRSLLSDGNFLYIGTDRHVLRIIGDGPTTFEAPQNAFNEGGVLNQDCWRSVFIDGAPLGAMWITPDYRVYLSDFNTHQDVGIPIQDVLNTINPAANANVYSQYYALGAFNLYVLAIPTGSNTDPDTLCVFDLKARRWFIWFPTDQVTSLVYNINASGIPQIILWSSANAAARGYKFVPGLVQDRVGNTPVNFTCTMRTSWQDWGDATMRKCLNYLQMISEDPAITCTIEGASQAIDFATPNTVISNGVFKLSPFGDLTMYIAGKKSVDRFYRLTFASAGQVVTFLRSFTLLGFGFHRR